MTELSYMQRQIDRKTKRKAETLMHGYRHLDAIIAAQELEIPQKLTASYDASESQRSNQFYSDTEKIAEYQEKIDRHRQTKKKLDVIYHSMKPDQQKIWDWRYCDGRNDMFVINELHMTERNYYRLKREMIQIIAEAFFF